jgi:hypothetical protein
MPSGFMPVGPGRLGFPKRVIARHEVPKQSHIGQKTVKKEEKIEESF